MMILRFILAFLVGELSVALNSAARPLVMPNSYYLFKR